MCMSCDYGCKSRSAEPIKNADFPRKPLGPTRPMTFRVIDGVPDWYFVGGPDSRISLEGASED